jgi:hypothetical protein
MAGPVAQLVEVLKSREPLPTSDCAPESERLLAAQVPPLASETAGLPEAVSSERREATEL